jgi:hypothetical protein
MKWKDSRVDATIHGCKPKVLVCVLCSTERQGWINPELSCNLFRMAQDSRFEMVYATIKDSRPVECARNTALVLARDHGFEWCIQIDNDNYMLQGTPLDIIAGAGPQHNVIGLSYSVGATEHGYSVFPPEASTPFTSTFKEVPDVAGGDAHGSPLCMAENPSWPMVPMESRRADRDTRQRPERMWRGCLFLPLGARARFESLDARTTSGTLPECRFNRNDHHPRPTDAASTGSASDAAPSATVEQVGHSIAIEHGAAIALPR